MNPKNNSVIANASLLVIVFFFVSTVSACSKNLSDHFPDSFGSNTETKLIRKFDKTQARELLDRDGVQKILLDEFKPKDIGCVTYDFSGITIVYAIALFDTADDAYGMYSGLTSKPRERTVVEGGGELSYKSPYFAGRKGGYAFWLYSPTNPTNYAPFYREEGVRLIHELSTDAAALQCGYHWKILPAENRVSDSLFFIRSRDVAGIRLFNCYAAEYQTGINTSRVYLGKFDSENGALRMFNDYMFRIENANKTPVPYDEYKINTFYWKDDAGYHLVHRYRWCVFLMDGFPDLNHPRNFIQIMYNNMIKVRGEALYDQTEKISP